MRAIAVTVLCLVLGGCTLWGAGTRVKREIPPQPELERTRALIERAEKDPLSRDTRFKAELDESRVAYGAALAIWNDERGSVDEDDDEWQEIAHLNHVARQRANIVLMKLRGLAAQREIAELRRSPRTATAPRAPPMPVPQRPPAESAETAVSIALPDILRSRLQPRQDARGLVLTLHEAYFAPGSAELQGGDAELDALVNFLVANPSRAVACEGHTDSVGAEAANQKLSQQRARKVQQSLLERGLEFTRVTAVGYGSQASGSSRNGRRVEIVVAEPVAPAAAAD